MAGLQKTSNPLPRPDRAGGDVLRSSALMGVAVFFSRILGLVREQVLAYLFGAGEATDAYNVAFRIPNLLRDLFAEGAMSASLVPTFTRVRTEEGEIRAWRVAGLVFKVLFFAVSGIAIVGILFAPQIVGIYAPAFKSSPGKFELTVQMTRVMFPFFPVVALAAAFMGILNACGVFFVPAFASAVFNIVSIFIGVGFVEIFTHFGSAWQIQPIVGIALGVLAGGTAQAVFQIPALIRIGFRRVARASSEPIWRKDPALRQMLAMMLPGTIGLAATQVSILVNTILATSQGRGAVSWLAYAFRLMQFPIGIFGVSLAAATLPKISQQWVLSDFRGASQTLTRSLRYVFAINLPASAGLAFLGFPIIQLIFQYGKFSVTDAEATAFALAMYSIGLTAYSAVKVLVPACYAMGNTRLPVISSALTVGFTVIFNIAMVHPFGYWGLALGTSAGAFINAGFLLYAIRQMMAERGEKLSLGLVVESFLKQLVLAILMGAICYYSYWFFDQYVPDRPSALIRVLKVGPVILEGIIALLIIGRIAGMQDTVEMISFFSSRIKKKLRPRAS